MSSYIRIRLVGVTIMVSAIYGVLISADTQLAETVATIYIAIVLTLFIVVNSWRQP